MRRSSLARLCGAMHWPGSAIWQPSSSCVRTKLGCSSRSRGVGRAGDSGLAGHAAGGLAIGRSMLQRVVVGVAAGVAIPNWTRRREKRVRGTTSEDLVSGPGALGQHQQIELCHVRHGPHEPARHHRQHEPRPPHQQVRATRHLRPAHDGSSSKEEQRKEDGGRGHLFITTRQVNQVNQVLNRLKESCNEFSHFIHLLHLLHLLHLIHLIQVVTGAVNSRLSEPSPR